jgi:hypothetical protein
VLDAAVGVSATDIDGGTIGIAIFSTIAAGTGILAGPQAASGISHAVIAAALLAGAPAGSRWPSCQGHVSSWRSCG